MQCGRRQTQVYPRKYFASVPWLFHVLGDPYSRLVVVAFNSDGHVLPLSGNPHTSQAAPDSSCVQRGPVYNTVNQHVKAIQGRFYFYANLATKNRHSMITSMYTSADAVRTSSRRN